jgi:hypothetical protein
MRAALIAALLLIAAQATAQPCHGPAALAESPGLKLALDADFATYRTERYEGDYQGLGLRADYHARDWRLRLSMPAYQLSRNGLRGRGLGDLLLAVELPLWRAPLRSLELGVSLAASLPTGDASLGLGMGHVMAMPNAWLSWSDRRFFAQAQLGYGRSLGAGHAGGRPLVNPMNASELEAGSTVGFRIAEQLTVRGGAYGAAPVGDPSGRFRAAAFTGVQLRVDRFEIGLDGHLPLAGDAFLGRVLFAAGARF